KAHRDVVADHLEGDLIHDLRDHRIHLAGHDRGSGLHRRQVDLAQARTRSAGQEPQVVAGLGELHGDALEHTGELHERAAVLRRLDQIGRGYERNAGDFAESPAYQLRVVRVRVDARADGRGAEV